MHQEWNRFTHFIAMLHGFVSRPWTFWKITVDAAAVLVAVVLYTLFRINWSAWFRAMLLGESASPF